MLRLWRVKEYESLFWEMAEGQLSTVLTNRGKESCRVYEALLKDFVYIPQFSEKSWKYLNTEVK